MASQTICLSIVSLHCIITEVINKTVFLWTVTVSSYHFFCQTCEAGHFKTAKGGQKHKRGTSQLCSFKNLNQCQSNVIWDLFPVVKKKRHNTTTKTVCCLTAECVFPESTFIKMLWREEFSGSGDEGGRPCTLFMVGWVRNKASLRLVG